MIKQFISFLGGGKYIECIYFYGDEKSDIVTYVQTAVVKLLCRDFTPNDKITFFVTDFAEEKNKEKILQEFENFGLLTPHFVRIPDVKKEQDVWDIFNIVFNELIPNSEVIFDITHSFRFFPMISMALLNYASYVKDIQIRGIYYGAFEVLGPTKEVEKKIPVEKRIAPILNLTPLALIQKWSAAVQSFTVAGDTKQLKQLVDNIRNEKYSKAKGNVEKNVKEFFDIANPFVNSLVRFTNDLQTNRGDFIFCGQTVKLLRGNLDNFKEKAKNASSEFSPFYNLSGKIEEKVKNFKGEKTIENIFQGIDWCLKHNLTEQAITQLQEGIITYLCESYDLNYKKLEDRDFFASLLSVISRKIEKKNWNRCLMRRRELAEKLSEEELINKIAKQVFSELVDIRNDINHGGYSGQKLSSEKFRPKIEKLFSQFLKIIEFKDKEGENGAN